MKKTFYSVFVLMLLSIVSAQAQLSPAFTARLQTVLDSVCNKYRIRGVSAAVLMPNAGVWKGVHGISAIGQPITSDMQLGIGSNTKTYISSVMLLLEEQSRLSMDDTIGKWITGVQNVPGGITIRQLLNHTSGLADYTQHPHFEDSLFEDIDRIWTQEEAMQLIEAPVAAPGARFEYCNTNYLLAGIIIRKVTNLPLHTALRNYLLTPQNLSNTSLFPDESPLATVAHPWSYIGSGSYQEDLFSTYNYSNNGMFSMASSAGAILSTAEDNAQFWHRLISGGIINASSLSRMLTFVPLYAGSRSGYGLGIFKYPNSMNGHTIYTHGGTNIGYINENIVDSVTGTVISVLTNQDSIYNDQLMAVVIRALHKVTIQMPTTAIHETARQSNATRIYPNPAHGKLTVDHLESNDAVLVITDLTGKTVARQVLKPGKNELSIEQMTPGVYNVSVWMNKGPLSTQRLVIQ